MSAERPTPDADLLTQATTDHQSLDLSIASRAAIGFIKGYQYVSAGRPSPCRHVPSCSTYAIEAVEQHGAVRGTGLAVRRLGRCHPWGTQGYDPVPAPRRRGTNEEDT